MNLKMIEEQRVQLLHEIERDRLELFDAIEDFKDSVSAVQKIRAYPKSSVAGCAALGFLVGIFI